MVLWYFWKGMLRISKNIPSFLRIYHVNKHSNKHKYIQSLLRMDDFLALKVTIFSLMLFLTNMFILILKLILRKLIFFFKTNWPSCFNFRSFSFFAVAFNHSLLIRPANRSTYKCPLAIDHRSNDCTVYAFGPPKS